MKKDGMIALSLAVLGSITWGSSFIQDLGKFDFELHYTEWLNPLLMMLIVYTLPLGVIVFVGTFGFMLIKDDDGNIRR